MLSINNPVQIQPNFQGSLRAYNLQLPAQKLAEVQRLFQTKTKGLPDVTLYNECPKAQLEQYEHTTYFILEKGFEKIITLGNRAENSSTKGTKPFEKYILGTTHGTIATKNIQKMFKSLSADEIATELANITKWANHKEKIKELKIKLIESNIFYNQIVKEFDKMKNSDKTRYAIAYKTNEKIAKRNTEKIQEKIKEAVNNEQKYAIVYSPVWKF